MLLKNERRSVPWLLGVTQIVTWGVLYYTPAIIFHASCRTAAEALQSMTAWSTGLIGAAIVAPMVGARVDRGGAAGILPGGVLLGVAGCFLWIGTTNVVFRGLSALLLGLSSAFALYEPLFAWVLRERSQGHEDIARITLIGGLAAPLMVPVDALLLQQWGWRHTVLLHTALLVFVAFYYRSLFRREPRYSVPLATKALNARSRVERLPVDRGGRAALFLAFTAYGIVSTVLGIFAFPLLRAPGLLSSSGNSAAVSATAVSLLGGAKVVARLLCFTPAWRSRGAQAGVYVALLLLVSLLLLPLVLGQPLGILFFCLLYGAANGLMTVVAPLVTARFCRVEGFGAFSGRVRRVVALACAGVPLGVTGVMQLSGVIDGVEGYLIVALLLLPLGGIFFFSMVRIHARVASGHRCP